MPHIPWPAVCMYVYSKVEVVLICEQDQGELDSKVVAIGDELLNYVRMSVLSVLHSC